MDHRQLGKIRACPFATLACEMSSVPTAGVSFWRGGLAASCPSCEGKGVEGSTYQLTAGKRASPSNSRVSECGLVVLKSPSWKLPWLLSFSAVAGGRSLHKQTWNLPEVWAAVMTSWLPLLPSCSSFLGVAKQRSHFSCHTQVKWLHLLLSSQHMLLWCDPLLD